MRRVKGVRLLSALLALVMLFSCVPMTVFAAEEDAPTEPGQVQTAPTPEVTTPADPTPEVTTPVDPTPEVTTPADPTPEVTTPADPTPEVTTPADPTPEVTTPVDPTPEVTTPGETDPEAGNPEVVLEENTTKDYATFLAALKVLEGYADSYADAKGGDRKELVINYIRTGVERYTEGNWITLAGEEKTAFVNYVAEQDSANGTNAAILRDIALFKLPNGNQVDFGHMFGTLNIAYISAQASGDLGGWAGDICDLMLYSKGYGYVPEGTVEEKAAFILKNCFGVDADDAFGMDDFYGDMDAFYLITKIKGTNAKLSEVAEAYFVAGLTNEDRAEYFMKNRFSNLYTPESVRTAVYEAYKSNVGLQVLEADRGLSDDNDLRTACCYAFADYLYSLAGDTLEEPTGGEDDTPEADTGLKPFSVTNSVLAPGITQSIVYAFNENDGQVVYYSSMIDLNRDDVHIFANYKDNDPSKGWGMQRLVDQMNAAQANHSDPNSDKYIENYRSIVGINADFYNMSTGAPSGALVMEGTTYRDKNTKATNFFAILDDGTPIIGTKGQWDTYKDRVQEAVGGSIIFIQNGEIVEDASSYYSEPGTRSCVGITADGKVMFLVVDGRQSPFSVGADVKQTAQIMLDAGCVTALHLDGGGSATYASKPTGSDTVKLISSPSDGYQRSVSDTLLAVSTAKSSNEFEYATISSDYEYLTIGTSLQMTAAGVNNIGGSIAIPEGAVWKVSDETIGTIDADGLFTAADNGETTVQLVLNGKVVGEKKLQVVIPDAIAFEKESYAVVYGVPTKLNVIATYAGNSVAYNDDDFLYFVEYEVGGYFDGPVFTAYEKGGIRSMRCAVIHYEVDDLYVECTVNMYSSDEAVFDFGNVTAGNRSFAWNRDVSNSTTKDNYLYQIVTPGEDMELNYTFAMDMRALEVPEQLADLTYMLPGADSGADAFSLMLMLAERISTYSEVKVTANFSKDLDVDISNLKIVNEYFELRDAQLDPETNTLTIVCGWIDQTAAIDPSTANGNCILSGITAVPKAGAKWDSEDRLAITNTGDVSYKIYLRANALYTFAQNSANQQKYGLTPFENKDIIINGATEKGAWFGQTYTDFEDSFVLDSTMRNGWEVEDGVLFYYVNNLPVSGLQKVPAYEDASVKIFCDFAENGALQGKRSGMIEYEGNLYYAVNGEVQTGWWAFKHEDDPEQKDYYYFYPETGKAADGKVYVTGYHFTFTDHILTEGELVTTSDGKLHYRWGNGWLMNQWVTVDGKQYFAGRDAIGLGYFVSGIVKVRERDSGTYVQHLFGEDCAFMEDYNGLYTEADGDVYLIKNGKVVSFPGLVKDGSDYYYFCEENNAVRNGYRWTSKHNNVLPEALYMFDNEGKLVQEKGIAKVNGKAYYFKNWMIQRIGMFYYDGAYYYASTSAGQLITNTVYYASKTNDLLPADTYTFDEYGRIVEAPGYSADVPNWATPGAVKPPEATQPPKPTEPPVDPNPTDPPVTEPEVPEVKAQEIREVNGKYYYYRDGVLQKCGMFELDGEYYYSRTSGGELITSRRYWTTKTNDLLPAKTYTFDAYGRIMEAPGYTEAAPGWTYPDGVRPPVTDPTDPPVNPDPPVVDPTDPPVTEPEKKNGIYEENGKYYYYVNDVMQKCGLFLLDGYYYYARTSTGELICSRKYWTTKTNDLLPAANYQFDAQGRMIIE